MKRQVKVSAGSSVGRSVSESVGEVVAATGTGLLDVYTGAVVAYSSSRRLRDAYTGALIRVRRSSDNAEQDIGFDSGTGLIDEAALTTFVGANNGLVTTIYNQVIGDGFNLTIGTAGLQPAIVLAGVVQTFGTNSRPAPNWDGVDDRLSAASVVIQSDEVCTWWACHTLAQTAFSLVVNFGTTAVGAGEFAIHDPAAVGTIAVRVNSTTDTTLSPVTPPISYVGRARIKTTSGSTLRNIRINKGAEATGTAPTGNVTTQNLHVGNFSGGTDVYTGLIGEVLIYRSITPATTDGIDDSMMTFWGIT